MSCNSTYRLRYWNSVEEVSKVETPAAEGCNSTYRLRYWNAKFRFDFLADWLRCNSTYRLRYWNSLMIPSTVSPPFTSCNSTYRLRYWNWKEVYKVTPSFHQLQQYLPFTVLKRIGVLLWKTADAKTLQQYLPFTVLKQIKINTCVLFFTCWSSTYHIKSIIIILELL